MSSSSSSSSQDTKVELSDQKHPKDIIKWLDERAESERAVKKAFDPPPQSTETPTPTKRAHDLPKEQVRLNFLIITQQMDKALEHLKPLDKSTIDVNQPVREGWHQPLFYCASENNFYPDLAKELIRCDACVMLGPISNNPRRSIVKNLLFHMEGCVSRGTTKIGDATWNKGVELFQLFESQPWFVIDDETEDFILDKASSTREKLIKLTGLKTRPFPDEFVRLVKEKNWIQAIEEVEKLMWRSDVIQDPFVELAAAASLKSPRYDHRIRWDRVKIDENDLITYLLKQLTTMDKYPYGRVSTSDSSTDFDQESKGESASSDTCTPFNRDLARKRASGWHHICELIRILFPRLKGVKPEGTLGLLFRAVGKLKHTIPEELIPPIREIIEHLRNSGAAYGAEERAAFSTMGDEIRKEVATLCRDLPLTLLSTHNIGLKPEPPKDLESQKQLFRDGMIPVLDNWRRKLIEYNSTPEQERHPLPYQDIAITSDKYSERWCVDVYCSVSDTPVMQVRHINKDWSFEFPDLRTAIRTLAGEDYKNFTPLFTLLAKIHMALKEVSLDSAPRIVGEHPYDTYWKYYYMRTGKSVGAMKDGGVMLNSEQHLYNANDYQLNKQTGIVHKIHK